MGVTGTGNRVVLRAERLQSLLGHSSISMFQDFSGQIRCGQALRSDLRSRLSQSQRTSRISDMVEESKQKHHKWTPEEIRMLGVIPDPEIAQGIGISLSSVKSKRKHL